jgi:hypothetical protein
MGCFQERENCLSCLSVGCFWGSLGDGSTWCVPDPSVFGNPEASLISPGNWKLCPTVLPIVKAPVYSEYQLPDFVAYGLSELLFLLSFMQKAFLFIYCQDPMNCLD